MIVVKFIVMETVDARTEGVFNAPTTGMAHRHNIAHGQAATIGWGCCVMVLEARRAPQSEVIPRNAEVSANIPAFGPGGCAGSESISDFGLQHRRAELHR